MEAFIRARREDLVEVHLLRTRLGPVMPFHDLKKLRCVTLEKWGPQDGDPILDNFSAAVKNGDLRQLEAITIKLRPCWPTGSEGDALDKILRNYPPACRLYGYGSSYSIMRLPFHATHIRCHISVGLLARNL